MASERTETLNLALTLISVEPNRYKIYLYLDFLSDRGNIKAFYRSYSRLQTKRVLEVELNEEESLHFFINF